MNKKARKLSWACLAFAFFLPGSALYAQIRSEEVLALGRDYFEPKAFQYAEQNGAEIISTQDGRSFFLWWLPENFDPLTGTVLVSIHGHGGWAAKDFQVWHPRLKGRGLAYLGIQWWYGRDMKSIGYAKPRDIYPWIIEGLQAKKIPPGHVIFTGFSMGGANSYAVAYLDRLLGKPYFPVVISNAGAMEENFPPNRPFLELVGKSKPFAGVHWILYCAERDEQRPQSCLQMEWTNEKLKALGAEVDSFIRDPKSGHGGFMQPANHGPALDLAEKIVAQAKSASR